MADRNEQERDARLFSYKRTAAENQIKDLFDALEAGDSESALGNVQELLYTIRRSGSFQGIDLSACLPA